MQYLSLKQTVLRVVVHGSLVKSGVTPAGVVSMPLGGVAVHAKFDLRARKLLLRDAGDVDRAVSCRTRAWGRSSTDDVAATRIMPRTGAVPRPSGHHDRLVPSQECAHDREKYGTVPSPDTRRVSGSARATGVICSPEEDSISSPCSYTVSASTNLPLLCSYRYPTGVLRLMPYAAITILIGGRYHGVSGLNTGSLT